MRAARIVLAAAAAMALGACSSGGGADDDPAAHHPIGPSGLVHASDAEPVDLSLVAVTMPSATPPSVAVPATIPTELTVTTLTEGSGRRAEEGDTVIVRYVGISSVTGEQFDANYDLDPLPVTLGSGGTIEAWETGLIGVRAGERLRMDIPADQAYGEPPTTTPGVTTTTPPGGSPPYGPLTFLVEVLGVVAPTDPADQPAADDFRPTGQLATEVTWIDLVEGDGPAVDTGMTAIVNFELARGDNGVVLRSTWDDEAPTQMLMGPTGQMDGMPEGMVGMRPGGRRLITVPYEQAFGADGFPQAGLPAATDVQVIVELLASY